MTVLTIAVVLLWILVVALAITVYALTRQIGVLYERVAPAGALMLNQAINVGDVAPELTVEALEGTKLMVGGPRTARPQLVFFLAPDCPICKSLLPVLKSMMRRERGIDIILASDGADREEHAAYVEQHDLQRFPYVLSEVLGRTYGVAKLPYAVLLRTGGAVGALGIVNSREHLESLFEAEQLGVASIQDYLAQRDGEHLYVDAPAKER